MRIKILVFLALVPGLTWGQYFQDATNQLPLIFTAGSTMDVESADLDNDGDLDLVLAMEVSENLVFFNDGTGQFEIDPDRLLPETNAADQWTGEDSEDVVIADFDGDDDLDLFFVSEDTQFHELLENDGNGSFTLINFVFPTSVANALAIEDLNGDDLPDIIIGNNGQNQVYINQGNMSFWDETPQRFPANFDQTQDLKLADIDGDGDLDLIEAIELGGNNIYTQENGVFTLANERLPNFGATLETRKILVFDANGDEAPDLYYCNVGWVPGASLPNRLLINDGSGFFEDVSSTHLPTQTGFTLDAVALDIDGDDDLDLVTTNLGQPGMTLRAYRNDGLGVFTSATLDFFPNFLYSEGIALHLFDANGDEYPDIYFGNHSNTDKLALYLPTALSTEEKKTVGESIKLLGNPVSQELVVNLEQAIDKLQVISVDGIILWEQAKLPMGTLRIPCSEWPAGTYFLQGEIQGQTLQQPLIKID